MQLKTEKDNADFGKGSVAGNIMRMAVPMTFAQLINVIYNIVDRIYIGRIDGASTLALTGVGVCFPIITMLSAFAGLMGSGGGPLMSIARGRRDEEEAGRIMGTSFFLLMVTAVILTVMLLMFENPILRAFGASEATFPYASVYMRIYSLGTVFVLVSLGMNPYINAQGFGKTGMMTVAIGAVLNIILDPILIFWMQMGVAGAALATIFSQGVSAVWVLWFLTGKRCLIRLQRKYVCFDGRLAGQICSLGLTQFIVEFTNSAVQLVCNKMLGIFGGDIYIAIMTVLNSIRTIVQFPVSGLNSGSQPVLGFNYGAGDYTRVCQGIRFKTIVCCAYTILMWGLLFLFPSFWMRIFNSDPELLSQGIPSLKLYFLGFAFMALQFSGQTTFVALGKAKQSVFFSLLRKIIIVVPLTLILPYVGGLGVNGVFLAEPISNLIGGTACYLTMHYTVYRPLKQKAAKQRG